MNSPTSGAPSWKGLRPSRWTSRTVVIAANGPSLSIEQLAYARARRDADELGAVIAISDCFSRAPWADLVFASDARWWEIHYTAAAAIAGGAVFACRQRTKQPDINFWEVQARPGVRPEFLLTGGNSGYQALILAIMLGARRIVLIGFDCKFSIDGKRHWFGDHPAPLYNPGQPEFKRWQKAFRDAAPAISAAGIEVINASRDTAIDAFPRQALEEIAWDFN